MDREEFNKKHNDKGLEIKILSTEEQFKQFSEEFKFQLDYRVIEKDSKKDKIASFYKGLNCNSSYTTTRSYLLYKNDLPVGVSTIIIEPKTSFKNIKCLKRLSTGDNRFRVCKFSNLLDEIPDFALIRGWRVISENLRGNGIGKDLRDLISEDMKRIIFENKNLKFGFWGSVASPFKNEEKRYLVDLVSKTNFDEIISPLVEPRMIGTASFDSIPSLIGYVKDGYKFISNFSIPSSFGPLFILREKNINFDKIFH